MFNFIDFVCGIDNFLFTDRQTEEASETIDIAINYLYFNSTARNLLINLITISNLTDC